MITLTPQAFQALLALIQRAPVTLIEQPWVRRLADEKLSAFSEHDPQPAQQNGASLYETVSLTE